ncbi:hypothetical protein EVAR_58069_1 [Eumeta japonica]|uniref:Uncharacterized protein n=1 Tax=Eumeta variegata TaxID=151549 RepID=A0A4C1ZEL7_EUMVA|nr:hypothetical protein EVAR_58069_1 [Eumeta japonica]
MATPPQLKCMQLTCATDAPPIKCSGVVHPTQLLANRHLVKLGLIKSERKRCPLLTTPPHCKKSADHRKKRAHREEAIRGAGLRGDSRNRRYSWSFVRRIILNKFYE